MRLMKLPVLLGAVVASVLVLSVVAASAQDRPTRADRAARKWRPPPMAQFSMRVEDGMGRSLRTFMHGGQTFVLGEPGDRFEIVVENPTSRRVEAVVSVDGRDVVTGDVASLSRSRGYIVPAHGSVRIDGFRQSMDQVAAFRFTSPESSYSARMGTPQNVGVIGVAIFQERQQEIARRDRRVHPVPKRSAKSKAPAPGRSRAAEDSDSNIGTGWGETRDSRVMQVSFMRASSTPARVITVRYDDADGLLARGIDVFPRQVVRRTVRPRPFPDARFAPPPQ